MSTLVQRAFYQDPRLISYEKQTILRLTIDCEQSLFSSKFRGKERKTSKRVSVTVNVTWERCREPLVAWASPNAHVTSGLRHRLSHITLALLLVLRSFPRNFEEKRDCSQSSFTTIHKIFFRKLTNLTLW